MKKLIDLKTKNDWRLFFYFRNFPLTLIIPIGLLVMYLTGSVNGTSANFYFGCMFFYFAFTSFIVYFLSIEGEFKLMFESKQESYLLSNFPPTSFNYKKDLENYLEVIKKENDLLVELLTNKELFYKYEILLEGKFKYLSLYQTNLEKISFLVNYLKTNE